MYPHLKGRVITYIDEGGPVYVADGFDGIHPDLED
jgi:hypothetical protein